MYILRSITVLTSVAIGLVVTSDLGTPKFDCRKASFTGREPYFTVAFCGKNGARGGYDIVQATTFYGTSLVGSNCHKRNHSTQICCIPGEAYVEDPSQTGFIPKYKFDNRKCKVMGLEPDS
ncbi:uncharacterized protein PGTG_00949 [Puccinia graminis f. sp. tritici CRL 75-36-700-3]|uniref:Hydrophobin n=1 Tax=Puccinia graminis f. sp. tritici (strain CRL 75-36-700-3 / race SCCL) TaxID=418459 RepID=E3JU93_PUCGT|nr:uncharacterized protein PGTG_00949 [Puccinia graminis f. sp. tritici CRL 75-36-700-3]EFP75618.1 hypothetical protein PGTG_00949 [Puccinia graminis f. sp. tritici CRL 75-36-700-3]